MPATGTPEPGGLLWDETLNIIRIAAKNSKDIGCRHLLGDLAKITRDLRDKANIILAKIENTKRAKDEIVKDILNYKSSF